MEKNKILYWVDSGTLLGAVRHQGLIPWDDDLDVSLYPGEDQKFEALEPTFQALGYERSSTSFGYSLRLVKDPTICLDVFYTVQKNDKIVYKDPVVEWGTRDGEPIYITPSELLPLKDYTFGSITVKGPKIYHPWLSALYGANWQEFGVQTHVHRPNPNFKKTKVRMNEETRQPAKPSRSFRGSSCSSRRSLRNLQKMPHC